MQVEVNVKCMQIDFGGMAFKALSQNFFKKLKKFFLILNLASKFWNKS